MSRVGLLWAAWSSLLVLACATARTLHTSDPPPANQTLGRATAPVQRPAPPHRLSLSVRPMEYRVELDVVPARPEFAGRMEIDLQIDEPTEFLWLHGKDLRPTSYPYVVSGGHVVTAIPYRHRKRELLGFALSHRVVGKVTLHVTYEGMVLRRKASMWNQRSREQMAKRPSRETGLFSALRERSPHGKRTIPEDERPYMYTFLEPMGARRVFPCFDEPSFKAHWQLTLRVPGDQSAFSNTPVRWRQPDGNSVRVAFERTPLLPSYLVAFAVGPFKIIDGGTAGRKKTPVRWIVLSGMEGLAVKFSKRANKYLAVFEEFLDTPYPFAKLDHLFVPRHVSAMENAGLILYDEHAFEQNLPWTIAHEIAHQWFGNLVTLAWWDDIWLNEGFATWFADQAQPMPAVSVLSSGPLVDDTTVLTRPVASVRDFHNFMEGTYGRGRRTLNAIEIAMGRQSLQRILRDYVNQHAWKNATTEDFRRFLAGKSAVAVDVLDAYLRHAGYPLVRVKLACARGGATVALSQEPLLTTEVGALWPIPLCMRYQVGKDRRRVCTLLQAESMQVPLEAKLCPSWLAMDVDTGYFRLEDAGLRDDAFLYHQVFSEAERLGLLRSVGKYSYFVDAPLFWLLGLSTGNEPSEAALLLPGLLEVARDVPDNLRRELSQQVLTRYRKLAHSVLLTKTIEARKDWPLLAEGLMKLVGGVAGDKELVRDATQRAEQWIADANADDLLPATIEVTLGLGELAVAQRLVRQIVKTKAYDKLDLAGFSRVPLDAVRSSMVLDEARGTRLFELLLPRLLERDDTAAVAARAAIEAYQKASAEQRRTLLSLVARSLCATLPPELQGKLFALNPKLFAGTPALTKRCIARMRSRQNNREKSLQRLRRLNKKTAAR